MNIEKEYVEGLLRKVERLQAERDALRAWINNVRATFARISESEKSVIDCGVKQIIDSEQMYDIGDFINETPQQCLRDVQAEAVLKFAKYISETGELNFGDSHFILREAFDYSESLRQGGAE